MSQIRLSPLKVTMLLHFYSIPEPFPNMGCISQTSALQEFIGKGLVVDKANTADEVHQLTPLGEAFVHLILSILISTQGKFVDLRIDTLVLDRRVITIGKES